MTMVSDAERGREGAYGAERVRGRGLRGLFAELLGDPPRTAWPPAGGTIEPAQESPQVPAQPAAAEPEPPIPAAPPHVDRLGLAWRGKFWILLAALVAGGAAYLGCTLVPPTYESTATLRVVVHSGSGISQDAVLAANQLAVQYAPLVRSAPVLGPAARRLGISGSTLSASISSGTVGDQNLMAVSAQAGSEREAQRRANAVAREFVTYIRASNRRQTVAYTRLVRTTLAPIETEIAALQSQLGREGDTSEPPESLDGAQATLATLLTARQRAVADLAQGVASSQPAIDLIAPAGPGTQVQPKPILYALVTALAAFLLTLQLVVVVGARRRAAAAG
jgi:hypothetical protein